jgi:hypothetical protein
MEGLGVFAAPVVPGLDVFMRTTRLRLYPRLGVLPVVWIIDRIRPEFSPSFGV